MSSRRARRRRARERARRPAASRRISSLQRLLLLAAGVILTVAGAGLLAVSAAGSAERLGRVAGILIVIGLVLAAIGLLGRV